MVFDKLKRKKALLYTLYSKWFLSNHTTIGKSWSVTEVIILSAASPTSAGVLKLFWWLVLGEVWGGAWLLMTNSMKWSKVKNCRVVHFTLLHIIISHNYWSHYAPGNTQKFGNGFIPLPWSMPFQNFIAEVDGEFPGVHGLVWVLRAMCELWDLIEYIHTHTGVCISLSNQFNLPQVDNQVLDISQQNETLQDAPDHNIGFECFCKVWFMCIILVIS